MCWAFPNLASSCVSPLPPSPVRGRRRPPAALLLRSPAPASCRAAPRPEAAGLTGRRVRVPMPVRCAEALAGLMQTLECAARPAARAAGRPTAQGCLPVDSAGPC
jgi:hypothetical protein